MAALLCRLVIRCASPCAGQRNRRKDGSSGLTAVCTVRPVPGCSVLPLAGQPVDGAVHAQHERERARRWGLTRSQSRSAQHQLHTARGHTQPFCCSPADLEQRGANGRLRQVPEPEHGRVLPARVAPAARLPHLLHRCGVRHCGTQVEQAAQLLARRFWRPERACTQCGSFCAAGKFLNGFNPAKDPTQRCPNGWTTFEPLVKVRPPKRVR